MAEPPAVLKWDGKEIELPVVRGTEGECAVDISKLRSQTGLITLDYGFVNTGSTESAITFVDGEVGILRYRGYDIDDLAETDHPSFLETAWLLIYGELPTMSQRDEFSRQIRKHTLLHEDVKRFYDGFPKDAHPMATLASVVNALATFYQTSEDPHDPEHVQLSIIRLLAKLPTCAAYSYKKTIGQPFLNLGGLRTDGIEIQFDWAVRLSDIGIGGGTGQFYVNSAIDWLSHYKVQTLPGTAFQDFAGTNTIGSPRPAWKALTTVGYRSDRFGLGVRWRFLDAMDDITAVTTPTTPQVGVAAYHLFDVFGTINVTESFSLRGGVTNLFDHSIPLVASSQTSTDPATFDIVGRSFYVGATIRF